MESADIIAAELTPEENAKKLGSCLEKGLSSKTAAEYLERDGPNELRKPPKPTLLLLFIMQLTGFVIVLLMVAAVASIVVNGTGPNRDDILSYTTGKAIFVIVFINAGIAAWTEHKAGDALEALSKMTQASIYVIRDGVEVKQEVPSIVKGDIVVLGTGDVVPADVRLVESEDLKVSESALTGEPDDVAKTWKMKPKKEGEPEKLTPENCAFSGCSCTNGKGKGIVVATGMQTRIGRIAQLMTRENEGKAKKKKCGCLPDTSANATPLQIQLESLGGRIGVLAIFVCVVIFIIGVAMDRTDPSNPDSPAWLYMILIAVTLAVAAIPEGIPLCVTISLSIGCKDMVTKNVLVRKLAAVETLGSASVICSDKTGTLTEGKMTMVNMWSGGQCYDVEGKGFDPTVGTIKKEGSGESAVEELGVKSALLSAILCCNTTLAKVKDPETLEEKWEPKGNSSEAPIVVAARKVGFSEDTATKYRRQLEIPFSSSRKMMLTVADVSGRDAICAGGMALPAGTKHLVVCKGAPNFIADYCTEMLLPDGKTGQMTEAAKADIMDVVDKYSSKALRVLAIATRSLTSMPFDLEDDDLDTDQKFAKLRGGMRLVGLVASIDPDRDGVPQSVTAARGAGIRVVMITGDYLKTAIAIAKNVNILLEQDDENTAAVDCAVLRPNKDYLSHHDMDQFTGKVRVFARAKPEDKLEIVRSLQRQGAVTAMTGDGVNDAPALNQANIGVAMGIQGTEVAKGASDMILTDDNFCSIVSAVEKGRTIYAGIQKFVAFIMSVHIAEVMQIFFCIIVGIPVMRTPLQILFLILVTDLPPSIALGMEPGESTILQERPRPKEEPVVLMWMWMSMIMNGAVLSLVIIIVYFIALMNYCDGKVFQSDIDKLPNFEDKLMDARTVAFISLVWSENIRSYCSRSFNRPIWHDIAGNVHMQKAIVLAQLCLYIAVLVPFFSDAILGLRGVAIGPGGWVLALVGPIGCLILCEACKLVTGYQMNQYQQQLALRHLAKEEAQEREEGNMRAQSTSNAPAAAVLGKTMDDAPTKKGASKSEPATKKRSFLFSLCGCVPGCSGGAYNNVGMES